MRRSALALRIRGALLGRAAVCARAPPPAARARTQKRRALPMRTQFRTALLGLCIATFPRAYKTHTQLRVYLVQLTNCFKHIQSAFIHMH